MESTRYAAMQDGHNGDSGGLRRVRKEMMERKQGTTGQTHSSPREADDHRQRKTETGTGYASTNSPGRGLRALLEVRR